MCGAVVESLLGGTVDFCITSDILEVMRAVERQFSDFLRQPNEVVAELEEHDVLLRRRGAPTLRLTRADREETRSEVGLALARMLRNFAVHNPTELASAVEDAFPWTGFLPDDDRAQFITELTQALVAAADLQIFAPVGQLVREWRASAEIHADPSLAKKLQAPIDRADHGSVPSPRHE